MEDCIFCKIAKKEIPATFVYEDDKVCAFEDIHPAAPIHVVLISKEHVASLNDINQSNINSVANVFERIPKVAKALGIADDGYRIISNVGENGGQTVKHIHFHMLAGKKLGDKIV